MNGQTVIVLSEQNVDLREIVPESKGITILARKVAVDLIPDIASVMTVMGLYINDMEKTPHFNIEDPAYVIINSTPQGFAAAIMIYGYYESMGTKVHIWVLLNKNNNRGKYIALEQFYMEGYDKGRAYGEKIKAMLSD